MFPVRVVSIHFKQFILQRFLENTFKLRYKLFQEFRLTSNKKSQFQSIDFMLQWNSSYLHNMKWFTLLDSGRIYGCFWWISLEVDLETLVYIVISEIALKLPRNREKNSLVWSNMEAESRCLACLITSRKSELKWNSLSRNFFITSSS